MDNMQSNEMTVKDHTKKVIQESLFCNLMIHLWQSGLITAPQAAMITSIIGLNYDIAKKSTDEVAERIVTTLQPLFEEVQDV